MNKEDILNLIDTKVEKFHVEAWNKDIFLRSQTAADRSRLLDLHNPQKPKQTITKIIWECWRPFPFVMKDGNRLFNADDIPALSQKSGAALEAIGIVSRK